MAVSKAAPKKKIKKVKKAAKKKSTDKANRKADPSNTEDAAAAKARNPKAFVFSGRGKAKLQQARSAERDQKRMHVPVVDTTPEEPPPFVVVVHGPPGVGKTTLIKNLIKHYVNQNLSEVKGPITVVSGKTRRLTFVECPQDLHGMIDAAKYADLVLLMVDGGFGFEMETFEFLNLLQVHGFPKVMGVLTHLDGFKDQKKLKKTKKALKHRFWAEIYQGAKLFYLSGMKNGKYMKREVLNLARFISVMKFRPLNWRMAHPYLLTDRLEDITPVDDIRMDPKCDREIAVYGYLRGTKLKGNARVHLAGVGDATVEEVDALTDPCPLPSTLKKRGLNERERLLYAPMADVGGLLYDKDAVYIDIPDWKMQYSKSDGGVAPRYDEGEDMVRQLQANQTGVDDRLHQSQIQLFKNRQLIASGDQATDEAPDAAAGIQDDGSDSEGDESDLEGNDSEDDSEDEEDDQEEEEDETAGAGPSFKAMPQEQIEDGQHRKRRRAVFTSSGINPAASSDEGDDSEDEDEEPVGAGLEARQQSGSSAESSGRDESDAESDESEGLGKAALWKTKIQQNAAALFSRRSGDMQSLVYGTSAADTTRGKHAQQPPPSLAASDEEDADDDDDLFEPRRRDSGAGADASSPNALDAPDSSRVVIDDLLLTKWSEAGRAEQLRNRFVTGDWDAAGKRDAARPAAEDEADEDAFGEFEDLETGEKFGADGDQATATAMKAIQDAAADEAKQRLAEKAAKKAAFNAEYDVGGGKGVKDGKDKKSKNKAGDEDEAEEETYYDAMKKEMGDRAARTKAAMDELDEEQRVIMEGHSPGTYLRLRFTGVPCELMHHFDPAQPLLVGGVSASEEGVGFMQLRFKRHRWFPKILKTRDPLVFSIGWRRFQSVPVYATEDSNGRHRMLKYTPEHMHCLATMYGALAPPNTGVLAIQTSTGNQQSWRISATGVVLNLDASVRIMKKLKLKGTPFKVHKHTAFIGGMFNSQLEVSKFEGASIRTVSGIRGIVKKALRPGVQKSQDGSFRATFEDKPLMSDIIFLRAWIGVDLPKFYNPVTNLLAPPVKPLARELKPGHMASEDPSAMALGATDANAIALPGPPSVSAPTPGVGFTPAAAFSGVKPCMVFKTGLQGIGYYPDTGLQSAAAQTPAVLAATGAIKAGQAREGWTGMRTVAQLRRELGVGPPRNSDSLYKPIERAPRKFNPLKIPKTLQAQLPFKSKVMNFPTRKRETLEQNRAITVREPGEKRADALVHALSAIRNAKTQKRREQQTRRREERKKKLALEEAWKMHYNKEERKKRYRDQGKAEALAEKRQKRD